MRSTDLTELAGVLAAYPRGKRVLVAVAGAPGSGKSTLAERLVALSNEADADRAAILPMDGYHYDDILLKQLGRHARKGAVDTFDVEGFKHMLGRLRDNTGSAVAVPVFDRELEIARAGARLISASVDIVIVEGNYVLLQDVPWSQLRSYFDLTVMVDVPEPELRRRLVTRWQSHSLSEQDIVRKVEEVDIPNGRLVRSRSVEADYRIGTERGE